MPSQKYNRRAKLIIERLNLICVGLGWPTDFVPLLSSLIWEPRNPLVLRTLHTFTALEVLLLQHENFVKWTFTTVLDTWKCKSYFSCKVGGTLKSWDLVNLALVLAIAKQILILRLRFCGELSGFLVVWGCQLIGLILEIIFGGSLVFWSWLVVKLEVFQVVLHLPDFYN